MRILQLVIFVNYLICTHIPTQISTMATREVIMQKPSNEELLSSTHQERAETQGNQGCQNCIKTTKQGNQITKTLIYHTVKPEGCQDSSPDSCTYNRTTYKVCKKGIQYQCYNPKSDPDRWALQIKTHRTRTSYKDQALLGISQWKSNPHSSFSVTFNVCKAANYWTPTYGCGGIGNIHNFIPKHKYLCPPDGCAVKCKWWSCIKWHTQDPKEIDYILFEKNETKADSCGTDNCNLVTLTVKNGSWFLEQNRWEGKKWMFGIGIDTNGYDPMSEIEVKIITATKRPEQKSLFWSYYEEMENLHIPEVSRHVTNTFVKLAEDIAHTLGVSNCFVCGGTNMGERWPWEAQELNYTKVLEMSKNNNLTYTSGKDGDWGLTSNLVGHVCYSRNKTESCVAVGDLLCTGTWEDGKWWSGTNETTAMDLGINKAAITMKVCRPASLVNSRMYFNSLLDPLSYSHYSEDLRKYSPINSKT